MNIGSFSFNFGKAKVSIQNLDGDKSIGRLDLHWPLEKLTVKVVLHAGKNWSDLRHWNFEIDVSENQIIPEPEDEEPEWEEEEDEDDDA
jgi:hypothetical protein